MPVGHVDEDEKRGRRADDKQKFSCEGPDAEYVVFGHASENGARSLGWRGRSSAAVLLPPFRIGCSVKCIAWTISWESSNGLSTVGRMIDTHAPKKSSAIPKCPAHGLRDDDRLLEQQSLVCFSFIY